MTDAVTGSAPVTFTSSPADLSGLPFGRYLEVEFILESQDPAVSPKLKSMSVDYACANTPS